MLLELDFFSSRCTGLASATVPEIARLVTPSSGMMQRGSNGVHSSCSTFKLASFGIYAIVLLLSNFSK